MKDGTPNTNNDDTYINWYSNRTPDCPDLLEDKTLNTKNNEDKILDSNLDSYFNTWVPYWVVRFLNTKKNDSKEDVQNESYSLE